MAVPKRLSTRRCARQGTHPGIRLWTVKQAPFLQPEKYTWDFDFGDITFTPKMDKRSAPGPFTGAPIIQGKFDGSGVLDHVRWSRGSQIDNDFYSHLDAYQGSISFWWTPEIAYSGSGLSNSSRSILFWRQYQKKYLLP